MTAPQTKMHLRTRKDGKISISYDPMERWVSLMNGSGVPNEFNPGELTFPIRIVAEITSRCNMNCSYCSQGNKRVLNEWHIDEVKRVVDEADSLNAFELTFRGAEATLHPNFNEAWDYAVKKEFISVNLITNGMKLDKESVLPMLENPRSKIIVSLDGTEEINSRFRNPHQYRKVMKWLLPVLKVKRNQLTVLSTLYRDNYPYIVDFASYLAKNGLRHYHVSLLKRLGETQSGDIGFVGLNDVSKLEEDLERVVETNPDFIPLVGCRVAKRRRDMHTKVPVPLFTEYYCGSGMKIKADGQIGISQIVFFDDALKNKIAPYLSNQLRSLGNIHGQESLQDIWLKGLELRAAQSEIAKQNYGYFLGLNSDQVRI